MCHKATVAVLLALLVTLIVAVGGYAAWQEAKTGYAFGVVIEPSGAGTFRVLSAYCGEAIPGGTKGCAIWVRNESSTEIFLDDWSVLSGRPDVAVVKHTLYNRCVEYDGTGYLDFGWTPTADASPGPVTFTVVITASEGCP